MEAPHLSLLQEKSPGNHTNYACRRTDELVIRGHGSRPGRRAGSGAAGVGGLGDLDAKPRRRLGHGRATGGDGGGDDGGGRGGGGASGPGRPGRMRVP